MTQADRQSALDALDVARPAFDRLDISRGSGQTAEDLKSVWSAAEAALRVFVGASGSDTAASIGGQALIREARQRRLVTFDEANALAAFQASREHLDQSGYVPSDMDIEVARGAVQRLRSALATERDLTTDTPSQHRRAVSSPPPPPIAADDSVVAMRVVTVPRRRGDFQLVTGLGVAVGLLAVVGAGIALWTHRSSSGIDAAIRDYSAGRVDAAVTEFHAAARAEPTSARPHVYLARIARDGKDFAQANDELQTALRLEPQDEAARREMGSLLLAQGKYDLARTFYIHALEIEPNDSAARGWLGCTLVRLGRVDEGEHWIDMAGAGAWSVCRPTSPTVH